MNPKQLEVIRQKFKTLVDRKIDELQTKIDDSSPILARHFYDQKMDFLLHWRSAFS